MGKIIWECGHFKIRVREVIITLVVLILLFFCLRSCQENETKKLEDLKKENKISNVCTFEKENINDLNKLLSRSDLCSEEWFHDYGTFIDRMEDQNKLLKKKTGSKFKGTYQAQNKLLEKLKLFDKAQNDKEIDQLEIGIKEYKQYYEKGCKK